MVSATVKLAIGVFFLAIGSLLGAGEAWSLDGNTAPAASGIDSGDTAWVLASSALILAMVMPGLALLYGGLVRGKNVLSAIMHCFTILCLVSVIWVLYGYSLSFGPDRGGVIGSLEWTGLSGVGGQPYPRYGPTIPHQAFVVFQLMFAVITPALITGAFAERMRFSALVLFAILWSTFIYCPLAHWVWGGGWLDRLGALDFAGGSVVHISSGMGGLACAVVLGRRRGYGTDYMAPHNLPLALVGTGLLWFGWFGFSGGSALGANATAAGALIATQLSAAAGALTWMTVEWRHRGKPTVLGAASGAVGGLVSITPAAGYVGPMSALILGATAGLLCYLAIVWKGKIGYDDALLLASTRVSPGGADGLFFGNPAQLGIQAVTVCAAALFAFLGTYMILEVVDGVVGLRVSLEEEALGLDLSQHNERGYS